MLCLVTRVTTVPAGVELELGAHQAEARSHALAPSKAGRFLTTKPVQFKAGELVGIAKADLPKMERDAFLQEPASEGKPPTPSDEQIAAHRAASERALALQRRAVDKAKAVRAAQLKARTEAEARAKALKKAKEAEAAAAAKEAKRLAEERAARRAEEAAAQKAAEEAAAKAKAEAEEAARKAAAGSS